MNVGVMKDYKLRDLRASHTLTLIQTNSFFFWREAELKVLRGSEQD
jgi:hypothetical protein